MATGAKGGKQTSFGRHRGQGGMIGDRLQQAPQFGIVGTALDSDGTLSNGRLHFRRSAVGVDTACQPQTRQTGGGEDDCVVVSGVKFSQTRINVSSNFQKLQIGSKITQLSLSAWTSGPDACVERQIGESLSMVLSNGKDQSVVGDGSDRGGCQSQLRGSFCGKILQAVYRKIGSAIQDGQLDFACEDTKATECSQSFGLITITGCRNVKQFDRDIGCDAANQIGNIVRLPQRQLAGASCNSEDGARKRGQQIEIQLSVVKVRWRRDLRNCLMTQVGSRLVLPRLRRVE